ncbi:regulating synaptic membrane exocytosis protein 2-like [Tachypleus tridentatus]|uniref:regulating synaptic membrane exocytosis protein 2-like n=1 Tax=Tachypleus tridentatus TaxID=6853 RepID=UPI003FD0C80B
MHGKLEGQEGKSDQETTEPGPSSQLREGKFSSVYISPSWHWPVLPSCRRASLQYIGSSQSRDLKRQFSQESRPSSDVTGKPFLEKGRTNVNRSPAKDGSRRKRSIFDQREDFQEDLRHHRDGGERGRNLRRDDARSRRQSPETRTRHERNGVEGDLERIREKENVRERGREHAREEREKRQVPKREELVFCGEFRVEENSRERPRKAGRGDERKNGREMSPDERRFVRDQIRCRESPERNHGDERRYHGDIVGARHVRPIGRRDSPHRQRFQSVSEWDHHGVQSVELDSGFGADNHLRRSHRELVSAVGLTAESTGVPYNNSRQKIESVIRNDSLSSDQSECVRPPPPKPYKHKRGKKPRQRSFSSSEDEVRSTHEFSSCEEQSEKGETEILGQRWMREEISDGKIKNTLAHPVTWHTSTDGTKIIGRMTLKKRATDGASNISSASALGLKVVGGHFFDSDHLGAVIKKVTRGSIADTIGHLRAGDEVLAWNGRSLQDMTYEEVCDITTESREDQQVELIVCRLLSDVGRMNVKEETLRRQSRTPSDPAVDLTNQSRTEGRISTTVTPSSSSGTVLLRTHTPAIGGRIQVRFWYDVSVLQLVVTVVRATGLSLRNNQQLRNPYVKLFLLPDRSEKSKRRTKTIADTSDPKWNQTFVYSPLRGTDLKARALELTVWDYDLYGTNDFLGEVVIDISSAPLDKEEQWYNLTSHEDSLNALLQRQNMYLDTEAASSITSTDHPSPPSTLSRLSDSDMSEYDLDDGSPLLRGRRLADIDGASFTLMGSDSSLLLARNQFCDVMGRDMSPISSLRRPQRISTREELIYDHGRRVAVTIPASLATIRGRSRSAVHQKESGMQRSRSPSRRETEATSRSLSPSEIRPRSLIVKSPTRQYFKTKEAFLSGIHPQIKRQLPPIPPSLEQSSRHQMRSDMEERTSQLNLRMKMQRRGRAMTSGALCSDSEVTSRNTVEKQLHAHPHRGHAPLDGTRRMAPVVGTILDKEAIVRMESDGSESSSASKLSINSAFSTQSERPRGSRTLGEFTTTVQGCGPVHPPRPLEETRNNGLGHEKDDGSLSDTAIGATTTKSKMTERSGGVCSRRGGG